MDDYAGIATFDLSSWLRHYVNHSYVQFLFPFYSLGYGAGYSHGKRKYTSFNIFTGRASISFFFA